MWMWWTGYDHLADECPLVIVCHRKQFHPSRDAVQFQKSLDNLLPLFAQIGVG